MQLSPSYHNQRAPTGAPGGGLLTIFPTIHILRVIHVSDVEESVKMELVVSSEWVDPRVTFFNLNDEDALNALSTRDTERLWVPEVHFLNAHDGAAKALHKKAYAVRSGNASLRDFNAVDMGEGSATLVSDGDENELRTNLDFIKISDVITILLQMLFTRATQLGFTWTCCSWTNSRVI